MKKKTQKEYTIEFTGLFTVMADDRDDAAAKWAEADFGSGENFDITDIRESD